VDAGSSASSPDIPVSANGSMTIVAAMAVKKIDGAGRRDSTD
jgi:hypothetical protein